MEATMDDPTLELILKLQFEDLERIQSGSKGKGRAGVYSDGELALQLYHQELKSLNTLRSDQRMARSIATAVQTDGHSIQENKAQELEATQDRHFALRLDENNANPRADAPLPSMDELDGPELAKLSDLYMPRQPDSANLSAINPPRKRKAVHFEDDDEAPMGESSADGARGLISGAASKKRCVSNKRCEACREHMNQDEIVNAPCNHGYCRDCIRALFRASYTDESLFPPRCCQQPFLLDAVRTIIGQELADKYDETMVEFTTPNRVYCARPDCSQFIKPANIKDGLALCMACNTTTCQFCTPPDHGGDCPEDKELQAILKLAADNGWRRCFSCRSIIELDLGCNHITCRCTAEFCYICSEKWKTCDCVLWNEDRLVARANQIVDRHPVEDVQRPQRVQEVVENLVANDQCPHQGWQYLPGPHRCEECRLRQRSYIYECRQCQILACFRCRRHRL